MNGVYRIADWDGTFERSQSKRAKTHHWVAMPIKHDGGGFRRISIQDDATDLFAAWCLIVQVGAKCKTRGVLADEDGVALDAEDLAIKTGFPVGIFERAFEFFSGEKIKWLICDKSEPTPSETQITPSETQKSASAEPHNTVQYNTNSTVEDIGDYPDLLMALEKEQSFENAIACIYASHDAFKGVPRFHVENALKSQPDRSLWPEAISGMAMKFAGAEMPFPARSLNNWLAGKSPDAEEYESILPEE